MVISSEFNFLENDHVFLDLNKDTLELKCSLDIDGIIYSGSNDIINANSPDDFNYYYTLLIQAGIGEKIFVQKVFVELTETNKAGVYSFNIKDFKKNLFNILIKILDNNKTTTNSAAFLESFNSLDTINVTLSVFYIDKNIYLPSLLFSNNDSFSEIANDSVKREKFNIPSTNNKENVFFVSETNGFPYKYEISWDKINLFKDFLVTIYCSDQKLLTFKTTDTKIDLFNFTVEDKTYNLKDLLGARSDASELKIEIKMIDSINSDNNTYIFSYRGSETISANSIPINAFNAKTAVIEFSDDTTDVYGPISVAKASDSSTLPRVNIGTTPQAPLTMASLPTLIDQSSIFLKYRNFFPNPTYAFTFEIDWSKYTNNKLTHIHNKVSRSDSTLVFDIKPQEYPFKVLYLFGNVDFIVILRDILAFFFTFPWDVLKDVGVTIKDILCCLNLDLNLNLGNTINKIIDILPAISQELEALAPLINGSSAPASTSLDGDNHCSAWKDILHDCIDSCKKSSTSDHNTKKCSNSSETNTSCKERNCNLRNNLILLQEKIIQFNNFLPRVMVGTYVFDNKDDRLGFDNLNNGTPYALTTISYSFLLNLISSTDQNKKIKDNIEAFLNDKKSLLGLEANNIDIKINNYKAILMTINTLITSNNAQYKTIYQEYIGAINSGNAELKLTKKPS